MREQAAARPEDGRVVAMNDDDESALPFVSLGRLLQPKWLTIKARMSAAERGKTTRLILLGALGFLFMMLVNIVLLRVLNYFRGVADIGILLAGKLMALILIGFFSILLLSNVIGALSTFFLARDLDMLVAAPADWLRLYSAKLIETIAHSSWMVVLMSVPIFMAYGIAYQGGLLYPLVALAVFIPFIVLPAVVGIVLTLFLVNVFPARRTRDLLAVVAVIAGAGLALLFRVVRPEKLARPEDAQSLAEFVAVLRTPTSPFLPSEWAQAALMEFLSRGLTGEFAFQLFLLWSTAASFIIVGAKMHGLFFAMGYTRAQEGGVAQQSAAGEGFLSKLISRTLSIFGTTKRELLLKEMRLFFRDSTQWSQLILLAVLVVVYIFNIRYLPLDSGNSRSLIVNLIPFLNLGLTGFVIASIAARFIFPAVSLEGRTLWLLRSSPLDMRELLWSKYWIGTVPLLVLAMAISVLSSFFLGVSQFMFLVSTFTIAIMTLALASLAMGFGTVFPQFDTENAAQIPTSFGGMLFMMTAVVLIGAVVILEARPVSAYLMSVREGRDLMNVNDMMFSFGAVILICGAAILIPIRIALHRLEVTEQ